MKHYRLLIIILILLVFSTSGYASNDYFDASTYHISAGARSRVSQINNPLDAIEAGFDLLPDEDDIKRGLINYVVGTGAANAYVVALTYAPPSYVDGMEIIFKAAATNTGASSINVNSLGVKSIVLSDGTDTAAGSIAANEIIHLRYNSTSGKFVGTFLGGGSMSAQDADSVAITGGTIAGVTISGTAGTISGGTINPALLQQSGVQAVTTTGIQTLTNKRLTNPKLNEAIQLTATATELNNLSTAFTLIGNHSDNIATAVTAIGATETTLLIDAAVPGDTTVPSTLRLWFVGGGSLTGTVEINSPAHITASPSQAIFSNTATIIWTDNGGIIYPEWWGIDGTADEVQFNAALDSGASVIEARGSSYTIAAKILPNSNQTLRGIGRPIIDAPAGTTDGRMISIESKDDVIVEGFVLEGHDLAIHGIGMMNGVNRITIQWNEINDVTQYGIVLADTATNGEGDDIKILYNTVTGVSIGATGVGIEIFPRFGTDSYSSRIEIAYNTVRDNANFGSGIKINNYKYGNIHNNYVEASVDSSNSQAGIVAGTSRRSIISNNIVYGTHNSGIGITGYSTADGGQSGRDLEISNNTIDGATNGIYGAQTIQGVINIAGNTISNAVSYGIWFTTAATDVNPSGIFNIVGNSTTKNITIEDDNSQGYKGVLIDGNSLYLGHIGVAAGVDRAIISNNLIRESTNQGIDVKADDVLIEGNTIIDANTDNNANTAGIMVTDADRPRILNNYVENIAGGSGNADFGIRLNNVDDAQILNSKFINMDTLAFSFVNTVDGLMGEEENIYIGTIAAGTTGYWPLMTQRSKVAFYQATLINELDIVQDAGNDSILSIYYNLADGTGSTSLVNVNTSVVNIDAFEPLDMRAVESALEIPAGATIKFRKATDSGAGQPVTKLVVNLKYLTY